MYVISIPVTAEITLNSRPVRGAETLTRCADRENSRGEHEEGRRVARAAVSSGEKERERVRRGKRRDVDGRHGAAERDANDAEAMQVKFLALLLLFAEISALRTSPFSI